MAHSFSDFTKNALAKMRYVFVYCSSNIKGGDISDYVPQSKYWRTCSSCPDLTTPLLGNVRSAH